MKQETDVNPTLLNYHEYMDQVLDKIHIEETEYLFEREGRANSVVSRSSKREIDENQKKFSREAKYEDIIVLNTESKRLLSEFRRLTYMIHENRENWLALNAKNDINLNLVKFYDTDSTQFKARRFYNTYLRTACYVILSIITIGLSLGIILSEITLFLNINLNPISLLLKSTDSEIVSTIILAISLTYFTISTLYPIFSLRTSNYDICKYNTDNLTLLMFTTFLSIIGFPMCLNFIEILKLEDETYFEEIMGPTENIPFLGNDFTKYYPVFLLIVALITLLNIWQKISFYMGVVTFEGSNDEQKLIVGEGEILIMKELESNHFTKSKSSTLSNSMSLKDKLINA